MKFTSTVATKFRYGTFLTIPSPPLEERARERRPFVSKFLCHSTSEFRSGWLAGMALTSLLLGTYERRTNSMTPALSRPLRPESRRGHRKEHRSEIQGNVIRITVYEQP